MLRVWSRTRQLIGLLWPHGRAHKALLAAGTALSIALLVLRLAQPWPLKLIVDSISGSTVVLPSWMPSDPAAVLIVMSLGYVLVSTLAALAEYWQQLLLAGLGNRILFAFRNELFRRLLAQSLSFFERRHVGELVTRIVSDTSRLRRGVNGILTRSVQVMFTFLSSIAVIVWLDWRIGCIVAACGGVAILSMKKAGRRILGAARKNRRREGQLAALVAEDVQGIVELQTFKMHNLSDERFEKRNVRSLKDEQKVRRLGAALMFRMEILLTLSVCIALVFGANAVHNGGLSLGSLVLIVHYIVGLYGPFRRFALQAAQSGRTLACAERLMKIMDSVPQIQNRPDARSADGMRGEISAEKVYYKSSRKRRIGRKWMLENITFTIRSGERVAVIGHNGAGKSSLLRLLLRLGEPQGGRVCVDGIDASEYTLETLRAQFSVVFQHGTFFTLSIGENIALGNPGATLEQEREVARRCGMDEWITSLKYGYDTPVHRQGTLFSGGERQKIAIARALLRNGRIWLLDEPTQGLDAESKNQVTNLLLEATRGRTTLWVTHDSELIRLFDRVLLLQEGKLVFYGTPAELASRPAVQEPVTEVSERVGK